MSSEEISLQNQNQNQNGLNVFQDDPLRAFNCARTGPKTRQLTGFIDDKMFSFPPHPQPPTIDDNWVSSGDDEEDPEEEDDDDDDDDDPDDDDPNDNRHQNNTNNNHISKSNMNSGSESVYNAEKMGNGKAKHSFATRLVKEGVRESNYRNAVTIADPDGDGDVYYSHYLQGGEGSSGTRQPQLHNGGGAGGCGFSGRKDVPFSTDSLRAILSDPLTGALMDDAVILPCGHSFGGAGIQHVLRMKVCYSCQQSVSEESVAPNLSLRAAVLAFRREEELQFYRSPKRRRERFDQDKSNYGDSNVIDPPRSRGVQFPFSVTDRVIIKGNKRTPQRFVGREAVVTTQCLNGWYVVKTLDNAESVKLQYRSLSKVPDDPSLKSKMGPNWL